MNFLNVLNFIFYKFFMIYKGLRHETKHLDAFNVTILDGSNYELEAHKSEEN